MKSKYEDAVIDMSDPRDKRKHILDAAYIVFSRKGFHRATVDEIIALADTGKGTVYNYFTNKEHLFYTLIEERRAPFHKRLDEIVGGDAPPLEKIFILTREFLNFYAANADLWRVLMHEMRTFGEVGYSAFDDRQRDKYREGFACTLHKLEAVIEAGVVDGSIKECDAKQAAYGLFSAIIAIVFQGLIGEDHETTAAHIAGTFLFGIAAK